MPIDDTRGELQARECSRTCRRNVEIYQLSKPRHCALISKQVPVHPRSLSCGWQKNGKTSEKTM